jgi:hypothetical protein
MDYFFLPLYNKEDINRGSIMKKKTIILSALFLTAGTVTSVFTFLGNGNLFLKGESQDFESHQIVFTAEDSSVESTDLYTHYFKLHQDDATLSGYSIDSKPEECLIMADSETSAGGDHICYGVVDPQSGAYASLYLTIPLTSINSFTSVVFRGRFFRDYWDDEVNEIQFGSESYSTIWNEFKVHLFKEYKVIVLDEIEINYTCAL